MTRAAFLSLAAVVPLVALWLAAPPDRTAVGLAVRPFGWPSLLVVHVLTAVPAAWLLARSLARRFPNENPGPAALLGGLLAVVGYQFVDGVGGALDSELAGFAVRSFVRSAICVLLALPWCVAAHAPAVVGRIDPLAAGAAALAALAMPALDADRLADAAFAEASEHVLRERVVRAAVPLTAIADVAPHRVPAGSSGSIAALRVLLAKDVKALTERAAVRPSRPSLEYGLVLIKLDRLAEAEDYLRALAAANPVARLHLGECLQLQGRWGESDEVLRAAVAEMLPKADKPHVAQWCGTAFDLLAESATKRHSAADREAVLREALAKLPQQAGYWHVQLGRHFKVSGRPFEALAEFDRAEELDPTRKPDLDALRRDLREHTPGCLVR